MVHRFYVEVLPRPGEEIKLTGDLAKRMTSVLRLPVGSTLLLFDGSGAEANGRILHLAKQSLTLVIGEHRVFPPPLSEIVLYSALIRPQRFEWLLEKATELGVSVIQPLLTTHANVRAVEFGAEKSGRWRRIIIEASEQSGRLTVPDLRPPRHFAEAISACAGMILIGAEQERHRAPGVTGTLHSAAWWREPTTPIPPISVFIGPEGGWTAEEITRASASGAHIVSFGPHILRAETAGIAALSMVASLLHERNVQSS